MSLFTPIVLGFVQGVGEFLPISSSGHLAIAQHILGMSSAENIPEFFDVLLHLGTLAAVFVVYWTDIVEMARECVWGVRDLVRHSTPAPLPPARRLFFLLFVGSLPMFAVLPLRDVIQAQEDNMLFVGGALIVTGLMLFISDRVRRGTKTARDATILDVVIVCIFQIFGTCPGISRSGSTITAGCLVGFDRKFAVRYSFLLSIPAVLAANALSALDLVTGEMKVIWADIPVYLVGVLVSMVVGYLCLRLLKMIAEKGKFGFFSYYCWAVGAITIAQTLLSR